MVFQHSKAQATLLRPKAIAIGTTTQHEVEQALRPAPGLESREQLTGVAPLDTCSSSRYLALDERRQAHIIEESYIGLRTLSTKNSRQAQEYLPLVRHPRFTLNDRRRIMRGIVYSELVQRGDAVRTGQCTGGREHYLGVMP